MTRVGLLPGLRGGLAGAGPEFSASQGAQCLAFVHPAFSVYCMCLEPEDSTAQE